MIRVAIIWVGLLMLALCVWPAAGRADSYGELTRFGEGTPGVKPGKINDEEPRLNDGENLRPILLGVDPTVNESENNSVYVLDEPEPWSEFKPEPKLPEEQLAREEAEAECHEEWEHPTLPGEHKGLQYCKEENVPPPFEGPITRHFRLQKFALNKSTKEYEAVASVRFEEKSPEGNGLTGARLGVEGIAVDPVLHRVYVLAVDFREKGLGVDETSIEQIEGSGNEPVAARLFAFSTKQEAVKGKPEGVLVPAVNGKAELSGPTELAAQSTKAGAALLEPRGITVDPETGDIIVMAHEDPGGHAEDQLSSDRFVMQRISPTGTLIPQEQGGRWVDTAGFFRSSEAESVPPSSPVVVGPKGAEQVDVDYERGIVGIAADFAADSEPKPIYKAPPQEGALAGQIRSAPLEEFPRKFGRGGELAASPYAEGNTLYAPSLSNLEEPPLPSFSEGESVLALSAATGSLLGWAGAQNLAFTRPEGQAPYACVVNPAGGESVTPVAAGSEGKMFVVGLEFLEQEMRENWGRESYPPEGHSYPGVVEFGPGGSGCPRATAQELVAEKAGNKPLGEEPAAVGESLTLSSYVNQADALKVEWTFGDGTSETMTTGFGDGTAETVTQDFHCPAGAPAAYKKFVTQCPSTHHAFARAGAMTVEEKIYTDDLASPTVTLKTTVNVAGGSAGPTAVLTGPLRVALGQAATFDGKASFDPAGPNQITEYHWVFGDGQQSTTTQPTVAHTYASIGLYTVSLAVTDANGQTSAPATLPSPVAVEEPSSATAAPIPPGSQSASSESPPSALPPAVGAHIISRKAVPDVKLVSASLMAGAEGKVALTLSCPADEKACAGQLALRTRLAGRQRGAKPPKPTMTTLASGAFALAGGHPKRVLLRLSGQARALLARRQKLSATLTIAAHDPAGAKHTTQVAVVVRAAAAKRTRR